MSQRRQREEKDPTDEALRELRKRYLEQLPTIAGLIYSNIDGITPPQAVREASQILVECSDVIDEMIDDFLED